MTNTTWQHHPENIQLTLENDSLLYQLRGKPAFRLRVDNLVNAHHKGATEDAINEAIKGALSYWES